jgi:hypothetical protein
LNTVVRQYAIEHTANAAVSMTDNTLKPELETGPRKGSIHFLPWLVCIGIFLLVVLTSVFALMDGVRPRGEEITQAEFLSLVRSNQVIRATVAFKPQHPDLAEVRGAYRKPTGNGGFEERPFIATNLRITKELDETLFNPPLGKVVFEARRPGMTLLSFVFSIVPIFLIALLVAAVIGVLFVLVSRLARA